MIVVDASVVAAAVGDDGTDGQLARQRLAVATAWSAPDLVDTESVSVLRRRWRAGRLSAARFGAAVDDLSALPIVRFPTGPFMRRAYQLRDNLSPYDAAYVALAEELGCPLLTADGRLARSPGIRCRIEVIGQARSV